MSSVRPTQAGAPTAAVTAIVTRQISGLAIGAAADRRLNGKKAVLHTLRDTLRAADRAKTISDPRLVSNTSPQAPGFRHLASRI